MTGHRAIAGHAPVTFTGYTEDTGEGKIVALLKGGGAIDRLSSATRLHHHGPHAILAGGQVARRNKLQRHRHQASRWIVAHIGKVTSGTLAVGDVLTQTVDAERRNKIRLNHTATHLLHAALQTVLGDHVMQKGSMVNEERLRFDFSHHKAVSREEFIKIESLVYGEVLRNQAVGTEECSMDEAVEKGARRSSARNMATMFAWSMCQYSQPNSAEHMRRTGDIGPSGSPLRAAWPLVFAALSQTGIELTPSRHKTAVRRRQTPPSAPSNGRGHPANHG